MKNVVIIGAGPAGLTAAYTLLKNSGEYHPVIVEASGIIGGISATINHDGNRIDMGGHRFFSKDARIMKMWQDILPAQGAPSKDDIILGSGRTFSGTADPEKTDKVFLVRRRVSRIYYRRRFFDYPISLKPATFINMGFVNTVKAGFGYIGAVIHKLPETSLENFYINRFGKPLYQMFFEDYTEKLWGVHPSDISADWGAQRVKGLSVMKVIANALSKPFRKKGGKVETSLIEEFYYPKYGPGQLWERTAELDKEMGAELSLFREVVSINRDPASGDIVSVTVRNTDKDSEGFGSTEDIPCDCVISSMPVKDLTAALHDVPENVSEIASALPYRDFITVGLLVNRLEIENKTKMKTVGNIVPDCWIYVQERDVRMGRIQIFNNWSPYMVTDPEKYVWVGLEYFCTEGDSMWNTPPDEFIANAASELEKIGIVKKENIVSSFTHKVKKAYPAYFGTYARFDEVREYLDGIGNLWCVGRNGQHRYNNMDHSMLTAIYAAEAIINGSKDKSAVWNVNTEKEYHETANGSSDKDA